MGRTPCCAKEGLNRGAWTATEDKVLIDYIKIHGEGKWRNLPKNAGLKRCGKSCRLRWLNYLKPDIKRGNISNDEEELIIRLHKLLGNRWSLIAGRLPGRTDNEIKNYWNTKIGKKLKTRQDEQNSTPSDQGHGKTNLRPLKSSGQSMEVNDNASPIRTKASRCRRVVIPLELQYDKQWQQSDEIKSTMLTSTSLLQEFSSLSKPIQEKDNSTDFMFDFQMDEQFMSDLLNMDFSQPNGVASDDNNTCDDYGLLSSNSSRTDTLSEDALHDSDFCQWLL